MSQADDVTIERWKYDNPSWFVIAHQPVITTAPDGKLVEEIEVHAQHRATGEVLGGIGADLTMSLAMVTHRISERCSWREWLGIVGVVQGFRRSLKHHSGDRTRVPRSPHRAPTWLPVTFATIHGLSRPPGCPVPGKSARSWCREVLRCTC